MRLVSSILKCSLWFPYRVSFIAAMIALPFVPEVGWGQSSGSDGRAAELQTKSSNLRELLGDMRSLLDREKALKERVANLLSTLKENEVHWATVQFEQKKVIQQVEASILQAMSFASNANPDATPNGGESTGRPPSTNPPSLPGSPSLPQGPRAPQQGGDRNAASERQIRQLSSFARSSQLDQLDTASRSLLNQRTSIFTELSQSNLKFQQLQQEYVQLGQRYWRFSDPDGTFTRLEILDLVEVVQQSSPEDHPAILLRSTLQERLGNISEASKILEPLLHLDSPFTTTALYAKASLLYQENKVKEAKKIEGIANRSSSKLPIDRWYKARAAIARGDLQGAEPVFRSLLSERDFELSVRKQLAMVYYVRSSTHKQLAKKAVAEAQDALDLDPAPDWHSHLVLGLCLCAEQSFPKASESVETALKECRAEPHQELCKRILEAIQQKNCPAWDLNHFTIDDAANGRVPGKTPVPR